MLAAQAHQSKAQRARSQVGTKWSCCILLLAVCGCATQRLQLPGSTADSAEPIDSLAALMADSSASRAAAASKPSRLSSQRSQTKQVNRAIEPQVVPLAYEADEDNPEYRAYFEETTDASDAAEAAPVILASQLQSPAPSRPAPVEPLVEPEVVPLPGTQSSSARAAEAISDTAAESEQWLRLPPPSAAQENIQISSSNDLISLASRDAPLNSVLALIAEQHGLNIVTGADVNEQISVNITDAPLEDALDAILATNGYGWTRHRDIIIVSKIDAENKASPAVQGRQVEVYSLNYVTAADIDKVVIGLLSPVGQSFPTASLPTDHRRTQEMLVVEDMPEYLHRIRQYIAQADMPPRQVQIEAHVLQVALKDNCRHGVNFSEVLRIANSDVTFSTVGLASTTAPTSMLRLDGTDLDGLLEALKATTDTKTLASPKVTVLNNQEARMQVGGRIGYLLSTTTQTSTLQSVNFLDVGVILTVLPSITEDGQVLVKVGPQVSTGRINPTTQLPESETTEVETEVLLADGEAIVIGGLIKETDTDSRNKVPILGDLWMVGWLFQRKETTRERNEIIITLVPRIVPDVRGCRTLNPEDVEQAHTPLLYGPLEQVDRSRYEPTLPSNSSRHRDRRAHVAPRRSTTSPVHQPTYHVSMTSEMDAAPIVEESTSIPEVPVRSLQTSSQSAHSSSRLRR